MSLFQFDPGSAHDDDFLDADDPDGYDFAEIQRSVLDRQLNLFDEENEDVDVVNLVENSLFIPCDNFDYRNRVVSLREAAMRLDLRMERMAMDQSAMEMEADGRLLTAQHRQTERDVEVNTLSEAAMRLDESPIISDSLRQAAMRLADLDKQESATAMNEGINRITEPCESEYSTPPHALPDEVEFLDPSGLRGDGISIPSHPVCHPDMSEPEFLTPISNRKTENIENDGCMLHHFDSAECNDNAEYLSNINLATEHEYWSPVLNQRVNGDFLAFPDMHCANESSENSGYLTPRSGHPDNLVLITPQSIQRAESSESIPDKPQEEMDDACVGEAEYAMELNTRHIARLRNNLTPPREPIPSGPEVLTPELGHLIAQGQTHVVTRSMICPCEANKHAENESPLNRPSGAELQCAVDHYDMHHSQASVSMHG